MLEKFKQKIKIQFFFNHIPLDHHTIESRFFLFNKQYIVKEIRVVVKIAASLRDFFPRILYGPSKRIN
jgi:hypothetical protein